MLPPRGMRIRLAAPRSSSCATSRSLATAAPPTFHPTRLPPYQTLLNNLETVRKVTDNQPLSLAEKILFSHVRNAEEVLTRASNVRDFRGKEYLPLKVDRLAMQGEQSKTTLLFGTTEAVLSHRRRSRC